MYSGRANNRIVSKSGASCLFIAAIPCSYSKSCTFLTPRTIALAPSLRATLTVKSEGIATAETFGKPLMALFTKVIFSWGLNKGCLVVFVAIATITSSNKPLARLIKSRWPLVKGSKLPGKTAFIRFPPDKHKKLAP